jgi:hypothetical protein
MFGTGSDAAIDFHLRVAGRSKPLLLCFAAEAKDLLSLSAISISGVVGPQLLFAVQIEVLFELRSISSTTPREINT